jgi:hypothetical protein
MCNMCKNTYLYIDHQLQGRPSWPVPIQDLTSEIYDSILDIC